MLTKIIIPFLLYLCSSGVFGEHQEATQFDSPWYAVIDVDGVKCGGSLFKNRFVITAAHCFDDLLSVGQKKLNMRATKNVKIVLGEWKTDTDPDCEIKLEHEEQTCDPVTRVSILEVSIHPNYSTVFTPEKYVYDIAIIKLDEDVKESSIISSINLPSSQRCSSSFLGEIWTFTGFGGKLRGGNDSANVKKKADMQIITRQEALMHGGDLNTFSEKNVFAVQRGVQICIGHTGSAVTRTVHDLSYLEGIVLIGEQECKDGGHPTPLLRVSCFTEWINTNT